MLTPSARKSPRHVCVLGAPYWKKVKRRWYCPAIAANAPALITRVERSCFSNALPRFNNRGYNDQSVEMLESFPLSV